MLVRSSSPHTHASHSSETVMRLVLVALVPAVIAGLYHFGMLAAMLLVVTLLATFVFDLIFQKIAGMRLHHYSSSYVTSILLYLVLPPTVPLWIPVLGIGFALGVGKYLFGRGNSIFNPALVGRAFLVVSWPAIMTSWITPDGVTGATPLALAKQGTMTGLGQMFRGSIAGCIGETSAIALLLGGLFLTIYKIIDIRVPLTYIGGVFVLSWILGANPMLHILGGGLMIGAFFIETDYGTTPITLSGRLIFALGCAALTIIFRFYSSMAEGVMFSILLMNAAAPLIDRYTMPKPFGYSKDSKGRK